MGELNHAEIIVNATQSSGTPTDVSGLSIPVVVAANSDPVWIEFGCAGLTNTAANGGAKACIVEDGSIICTVSMLDDTAAYGAGATRRIRRTPTAGAHTYKIQLARIVSGTATITASDSSVGTNGGPAYITAFTRA